MSVQVERVRWRALVDTIRLGPRCYRVVRPTDRLSGASLHETWHGFDMKVDQKAAMHLAMAWGLASRSRHTLVYLPLRRSGGATVVGAQAEFDLVLLHHSLAFPAARWKHVRRRLAAGTPLRVTLPAGAFERRPLSEHLEYTHRGFHDHLRWNVAAGTLFLVGSRRAFRLEADQIRGLTEDGPGYVAAFPGDHCCAEINIGRVRMGYPDKRRPWSELHIVYKPTGIAGDSTSAIGSRRLTAPGRS
jgi:hypothetical protein